MGFADVAASGAVSADKNLTVVSHVAGSGVYCMKLNSGTPLNVVAMVDNSGADPRSAFVAGDTNPTVIAQACPVGGAQFEMATGDSTAKTFTDEAFFLLVN